jgi:hypothetical protein
VTIGTVVMPPPFMWFHTRSSSWLAATLYTIGKFKQQGEFQSTQRLSWSVAEPGNCFSGFPVAHPVEEADAAFRNLIFEEKIQRMKFSLGFLNMSLNEMISL